MGFDGALEATQKIIAGDMDATVAQAPYDMGKIGGQTALDARRKTRQKTWTRARSWSSPAT